MSLVELIAPKIQVLYLGFTHALDGFATAKIEPPPARSSSLSRTLDLSESRAHDSALKILGAYKLTGNFHVNLEIVLKDLGAFDKVTYEIEPENLLPFHRDCRHVAFSPNEDIPMERFCEIMRSIKDRIGFGVCARPVLRSKRTDTGRPDRSSPGP
jgi:hypothetical protein